MGALLALAACFLILPGGGDALASHVGCGDTITANTKLHGDLTNCPNNGIVIGADGIRLNLNGHTIDGDGAPAPGCDPVADFCDTGVVNQGHDGIVVRGGTIREFDFGAFFFRVNRSRMVELRATRHRSFGLVFARVTRSVVRESSLSRNIAPEGDGLGIFACDQMRIAGNTIRRNPGPGIHLGDSSANVIAGNRFSRDHPAVLIEGNRNEVRDNRVRRGAGIVVNPPGNRNVIAGNRVQEARDSIAMEEGRGNLVARNVVVGARGEGIRLGLTHPPIGGSHNVIRRNRVRDSSEDGFLVNEEDRHSVLRRNVARNSGEDGFDVESRTASLALNRASGSAGRDFEVVGRSP